MKLKWLFPLLMVGVLFLMPLTSFAATSGEPYPQAVTSGEPYPQAVHGVKLDSASVSLSNVSSV